VLVVLVLALGACGDDGGGDEDAASSTTTEAPATTTTAAEATSTTTPAATSTTDAPIEPCPDPFAGNSPAVFDEVGGQYAASLTAVSVEDGTISFDVVQWLVGDDADAAYEAETGDASGVPNDYFIVNESDQIRTSPVDEGADIRLIDMTSDDVTLARPAGLDDLATADFEPTPFWLTFDEGAIVGVCQQYVP
jgi:hypothetical protein